MLTTIEITLTGVIGAGGLVWALVQSKMNTKMKDLDETSEKKIIKEVKELIIASEDIINVKVRSEQNELTELKLDFKEHKTSTDTKFEKLLEGITKSNIRQTAILGEIKTDIEVLKQKSER